MEHIEDMTIAELSSKTGIAASRIVKHLTDGGELTTDEKDTLATCCDRQQ